MKRLVSILGLLCLAFASTSRAAVTYNCGIVGSDFDTLCSLEELRNGGSITINGILFDSFVWTQDFAIGTPLGTTGIHVAGVDSRFRPGLVFTDNANNWNRPGTTVTLHHLGFRVRNLNASPADIQGFRMYAQFGNIFGYDLGLQHDSSVFIKDRPFPTAFGPNPPPQARGEAVVSCFASEADASVTPPTDCANTTRRDSHTHAQAPAPFPPTTDLTANMEFNLITDAPGNVQLIQFIYQLEMAGFLADTAVPDMTGNGVQEIAVAAEDPPRGLLPIEVHDGFSRSHVGGLAFATAQFPAVAITALPDTDGDGNSEIVLLKRRQDNSRSYIEIRNAAGLHATRTIPLALGHRALAVKVVNGDIDDNGIPELAVLSGSTSTGREIIEVFNAFGATNKQVVAFSPNHQVIDFTVVDDVNGDGEPEIAAAVGSYINGRYLIEVRNLGGTPFSSVTWLRPGHRAVDITSVPDANGNGVPEVAVLELEIGTGVTRVEVLDAQGAPNKRFLNYFGGTAVRPIALLGIPDTDGDTVPEIALLVDNKLTANTAVFIDNAGVTPNRRAIAFPAGYNNVALDLAFLGDADGNSNGDVALLMSRVLDGQLIVQLRNVFGPPGPWNHYFAP